MNLLHAEGPWQWLIALLGWGLWLLCLVGALVLLFAVLVGIWRGLLGIMSISDHTIKDRIRAEAGKHSEEIYGYGNNRNVWLEGVQWTLVQIDKKHPAKKS